MEKVGIFEKLGLVEKVVVEDSENFANLKEVNGSRVGNKKSMNGGIQKVKEDMDYEHKDVSQSKVEKMEVIIEIDNKKLLEINEIYKMYNVISKGTNSIYIVEDILRALPVLLSDEVKKETVLKIISSSGIGIEAILNDGVSRLKHLNDYSKNFEESSKKSIKSYENEIQRLQKIVRQYEQAIHDTTEVYEKQIQLVNYEKENLTKILDFIDLK